MFRYLITIFFLSVFAIQSNSQTLVDSLIAKAKTTVFSDFTGTFKTTSEIIARSKASNQPINEATGWNIRGVAFQFSGNLDSAMTCFNETYRLGLLTKDNITVGKALQNIGSTYFKQGNYLMASKKTFESLKIAEARKDSASMVRIYGDLANDFLILKKTKTAIGYLSKAIYYLEKHGDIAATGNLYNSLGTAYHDLKNDKKARAHYIKALSIARKFNNLKGQLTTSVNLAAYSGLDSKKAIGYLIEAEKLATTLADVSGLISVYNNMATEYYRLQNYDKSLEYSLKAANLAGRNGEKYALNASLETKANNLFKKGNSEDAFLNQKAAMRLKDSLFDKESSKQVSELEIKYQAEKKQQQILLLSKENTIQKLSISKRNTTIGIITGLLVFFAVFGLMFYNRYKLKQEARLQKEIIKQQDISTKAVLEAEENERRRISGELHDGVGQMFSTVRMNLSGIEDQIEFKDDASRNNFEKTLSLVDESCREVRSISHQMAPNVLLKSGLVSAVRDFITKVDERQLKINLDVQGLHERLNSNIEMVLYRVIQETVNNVIKHARANRLDIQLVKDPDGLSAMIEDNGIGFDPKKVNKTEGLGLKNIESRINYLKGTVDFDSSDGNGTVVSIWIPNA